MRGRRDDCGSGVGRERKGIPAMKRPIAWHRKNLIARDENNERESAALILRLEGLSRSMGEANFLRSQIGQAEKEGRDGFDDEKFMVKRKTK